MVLATDAGGDFTGLVDQLRWMIRDHLDRERIELAPLVPSSETLDSWAKLGDLRGAANALGIGEVDHEELLRVLNDHCDHLEHQVFSALGERTTK